MESSVVFVAVSGGKELRQSLLGVVVVVVRRGGGDGIVFEGVNKLGKFLERERGAAVCWSAERARRLPITRGCCSA
jgi:hypothetical protein